MSVNHNEVQKRTKGILDFTENMIKVSEHLNGVVGHAQALENELGGEGQQLRSFLKNELVPVLEEFENNPGSSKHQKQLATLLQDEENLESNQENNKRYRWRDHGAKKASRRAGKAGGERRQCRAIS
jgi:hypothetical protein